MRDMRQRASSSRFSSSARVAPHHNRDKRADATIAPRTQTKSERSPKTVKQKNRKK
jgi:hypothetical protein